MFKKTGFRFFGIVFLLLISACKEEVKQNDMGAISPTAAFDYMKKTKNLFIIDTAIEPVFLKEHFIGAVNIPYDEMEYRFAEVPKNVPVLLHCRRGRVVPRAYEILKQNRPDIPEISYINGAPLFSDYNEYKKSVN